MAVVTKSFDIIRFCFYIRVSYKKKYNRAEFHQFRVNVKKNLWSMYKKYFTEIPHLLWLVFLIWAVQIKFCWVIFNDVFTAIGILRHFHHSQKSIRHHTSVFSCSKLLIGYTKLFGAFYHYGIRRTEVNSIQVVKIHFQTLRSVFEKFFEWANRLKQDFRHASASFAW